MRTAASSNRLVLLVTAAVFINYIDRGNLATAAPLLQDELGLSASQLGVLFSAFYYGYVACMPSMGWLAERFGAKRVLGIGVAVWSIATLATGFAHGFVALMALRILLGIGESAAFPCASKVLANTVEMSRLGVANGIMSFGYLLGPAIGTLLGGYLMGLFGWRPVFVLFGAASLLWLLPWSRVTIPGARATTPAGDPAQPSFGRILRQRGLWGASIGHFAANYGYYFILSWLPFYLVKTRGFSLETMAGIASWAYLLNALSALFAGWVADRWIRAGHDATRVYKGTMALVHGAGVVCMIGMVALPAAGSVVALLVFMLVSGLSYPGLFAIPQIVAGPQAAGRWVGVQNAAGNVAGLVAPMITGILVDQTGRFDIAFGLAAGVNVLGLIGWVLILPKVAPLSWEESAATDAEPARP